MADEHLPPQTRRMALYAAGGGFGGALLAIVIAKILAGPCCCPNGAPDRVRDAPAKVSMVTDGEFQSRAALSS
ncbi:MAG: hypothetical protein WD795_09605 [Woeseia sp.]